MPLEASWVGGKCPDCKKIIYGIAYKDQKIVQAFCDTCDKNVSFTVKEKKKDGDKKRRKKSNDGKRDSQAHQ